MMNHGIYFKESGVNGTKYYSYGNTLANGGGHLFYTGGEKASQPKRFHIANDKISFHNPLDFDSNTVTNSGSITSSLNTNLYLISNGTGNLGLSNPSGVIDIVSGKAASGCVKIHYSNSSGSIRFIGGDTGVKQEISDDLVEINEPLDCDDINMAAFIHKRNTAQTITTGTTTSIVWNSSGQKSRVVTGSWTFSSPYSSIGVPTDGLYQVMARVWFDYNGTGIRDAYLTTSNTTDYISGQQLQFGGFRQSGNGTYATYGTVTSTLNLDSGDTITLNVYQNSGGNLAYSGTTSNNICTISIVKIGAKIT